MINFPATLCTSLVVSPPGTLWGVSFLHGLAHLCGLLLGALFEPFVLRQGEDFMDYAVDVGQDRFGTPNISTG